uniref:Pentacotripeptide-repeat region of PRORP domain-containing protein n=1 Tax=Bionectria ochroleuca TaxID=29856 RepID=A0A8H7TKL8_BIOOC
MPARSSLFDLTGRNASICRTCLHIRQRTVQVQQPWIAAYSSQVPRTRTRSRTRRQGRETGFRKPTESELLSQLAEAQEGSNDSPHTIRFFEQDGDKRVELQDDGSFEQSLSGLDATEFKESLLRMKNALPSDQEKEAFEEVMRGLGGSSWDRIRTAEDIEQMMSGVDSYNASLDAEIEETAMQLPEDIRERFHLAMAEWLPKIEDGAVPQRNPVPQIPPEPWTINQFKKIARLNTVISKVSRDMLRPAGLTEKHVLAVYKAYHAARRSLASNWSGIPINVWDFLWNIFSANSKINKQRFAHVSQLSRDMAEAGATLSYPQQLLTIEALFVDGWENKAIENWKRCVATLGKESEETFQDFWELGVRMHCRIGDLEHAESATQRLLANHADPRILLPVIQTLSERGTPSDHEKAWSSYRQMRELLGRDMNIKDYDKVVSYFLTTNQVENALFAFVDMMSDGSIDMKQLKRMPSVVANKFFLGKWLKRLIGAGDLDGAYTVVEFMRQKGVQAAPVQLNGLIGAWQRSGGADNVEKANDLAWKMIEARIAFCVSAREAGKSIAYTEKNKVASLPPATLETFCVLAENYRTRNLQAQMGLLWDAFRDAKISPDAFMMNQLLESYLQSGQAEEAEKLYHTLVVEQGVTPDPYTFSALWKLVGINRFYRTDDKMIRNDIETARKLFAETAKFKSVFLEDGMDIQLSRKILHTLRRLKDPAGFMVALTTLKEHFKFLPTETLVVEMVLGTKKLSWDTPAQRRKLLLAKREIDQELIAWADEDMSKLEGEKRGVALYEYLQKKLWPAMSNEEGARSLVDVAKQMGVYELLMSKKGRTDL